MMNIKKLLASGVIYYAVIYLAASILMFTFKLDLLWQSIGISIINIVTAYLIASKYYFTKKPKSYLKEGILFAIGISVIGFLIEIITMVYGVVADQGWAWYTSNNMLYGVLFGYVLVMVTSVVAAKLK